MLALVVVKKLGDFTTYRLTALLTFQFADFKSFVAVRLSA